MRRSLRRISKASVRKGSEMCENSEIIAVEGPTQVTQPLERRTEEP
jgi:hypothetical protein